MNARLITRVEAGIEAAAAFLFGGAIAYAAYSWLGSGTLHLACSAGAGIVTFLSCLSVMRTLTRPRPDLKVSVFNVRDIEPDLAGLGLSSTESLDDDELVLSNADRLDPGELVLLDRDRSLPSGTDPLMLDDILSQIGPDSRVVRLFDRKAMPTPAELKARIDSHLGHVPPPPLSDASQALSEALAQLRRSLR